MSFVEEYEEYKNASIKKYEEPKPFKSWLAEKTANKPNCKKCKAISKYYQQKGVRLK